MWLYKYIYISVWCVVPHLLKNVALFVSFCIDTSAHYICGALHDILYFWIHWSLWGCLCLIWYCHKIDYLLACYGPNGSVLRLTGYSNMVVWRPDNKKCQVMLTFTEDVFITVSLDHSHLYWTSVYGILNTSLLGFDTYKHVSLLGLASAAFLALQATHNLK